MSAISPSPARPDSERDHPALRNIQAIAQLEQQALHNRSALDRVIDAVTYAAGSALFAIIQVTLLVLWSVINVGGVAAIQPFDPYPFNLLTLVVSIEASFLSVFVLMSQNRMIRQADKLAHLNLQVDLLAEQELTAVLEMQRAICLKLGISLAATDPQVRRLLEETDVHELATVLDKELPTASSSIPDDSH